MDRNIRLLFVDDEMIICDLFCSVMTDEEGYAVETALSGEEALHKLESYPADVLITDVKMPAMDGLELLRKVKIAHPDIPVLIATAYGSIENAVQAMRMGAFDYIMKPIDFNLLRTTIERAMSQEKTTAGRTASPRKEGQRHQFERIIGQDEKMLKIYDTIKQVSQTKVSILITGESGTGKELIAEAIHFRSPRKGKPIIKLNCAALTEGLINSELFGHEKGSFTGAIATKKGSFELADGGSIFLDEIGDMPVSTQISLLRILETGKFVRVGGTETIEVDTRVICATNKDLCSSITNKQFREDLYYRINVVSIHVPSLRERKSDIPVLTWYFLKRYCDELKKEITGFSKSALNILTEYNWPGNVRELANVIKSAVVFCKGKKIDECVLPDHIKDSSQTPYTFNLPSRSLPAVESALIQMVLQEKKWNLNKAAKELNIARGTLYGKMKKYGISKAVDTKTPK
ncbi:MAG: sigma-54-dependent transcriptional regulator [bacterium]